MNKTFKLVLALSVLSAMGYAQSNLDNEVDAELSKMYSTQKPAPAKIEKVEPVSSSSTASQQSQAPVSGQPIYILNQATPTATSQSTSAAAAVQKQPTTVIEASPLTESRAENLRKARQDAETSTEAKIVEKLEQSRLDDEKRRAQVLFGDKIGSGAAPVEAKAQEEKAPVQNNQPQIYIIPQAPAPVAAPAVPLEKKEEVKEVKAVAVVKEVEADKPEKDIVSVAKVADVAPEKKHYFSALVGVPQISGANTGYVKGNYSMGFTFGTKYDEGYAVEGSFIYSNYDVRDVNNVYGGQFNTFDANQYSGAVAMKYYFMNGMVKPVVGGIGQYSYREYKWSDKNGYPVYNIGNATSHAIDVGALIGVEVEFSPKATVGLETRYMKNLANRRNFSADSNGGFGTSQYSFRTPLEELDYYTVALTARVAF